MRFEHIAEICHEANRTYCESLGDMTQLEWADAPQWQKDSAVNGVKFLHDNPDAQPSASHASWMAEKEAAGWKWGAEKDVEAKEHPCFLPYDQLPVEQRRKDYIFSAIVRACLAEI